MGTRILPSPSDSRVGRSPSVETESVGDVAAPTTEAHIAKPRPRWTAELAPLATSVALHAVIVAIGFATYQTIKVFTPVVETQTTFGSADIDKGPSDTDALNPGGVLGDPRVPVATPEPDTTAGQPKWNGPASATLSKALSNDAPSDTRSTIGFGPSASSATGGPPSSTGGGSTRIGPVGGGVEFIGIPGDGAGSRQQANRVVYVCDATGTMLGLKFELLKQQLTRSIGKLKPTVSFNVIFFRGGNTDGEWAAPMGKSLVPATPKQQAAAGKFVRETSVLGNGTNPLPALRQAFSQRPQVVYFLTDGEFNNFVSYDEVLAEVEKMNPGGKVKVHTILMMSDDAKAEQTLRALAKQAGGQFAKVQESDLR